MAETSDLVIPNAARCHTGACLQEQASVTREAVRCGSTAGGARPSASNAHVRSIQVVSVDTGDAVGGTVALDAGRRAGLANSQGIHIVSQAAACDAVGTEQDSIRRAGGAGEWVIHACLAGRTAGLALVVGEVVARKTGQALDGRVVFPASRA